MKQIWIFNHYATNMFMNKGGRHYWFAENLLKHEYSPTIFCANQFHNSDKEIELDEKNYKQDESNGVPFVFVKSSAYQGNGYSRLKNMMSFAVNLFSVTKKVAKKQGIPDVILASSVHPLTLIAGIFIAHRYQIPCICEVRDLWPEALFMWEKPREKSLLGQILIAGEHWIYRRADALIFTKEGDTDYIKEHKWDTAQGGDIPLEKCHYINNGVDIAAFERDCSNCVLDDPDLDASGKFRIVYTGAVRLVNHVDTILDAAKLLRDYSEICFLIYGDGTELERLQKRVADEGISNVLLKGHVNKKYIPYILSKSSVNLLNYSAETYNWTRGNSSNKLFEYMASGKPVISTVKMGYCILEKYQCGISTESYTPEALADAILQIKHMTREEYAALCKNARNGASEFDFRILTDKLQFVIKDVMRDNI